MIEFNGELSEECKKFITKLVGKLNIVGATICLILFGGITVIFALNTSLLVLFFLPVVLFAVITMALPPKTTSKEMNDYYYPKKIVIEEDLVWGEWENQYKEFSLDSVSQVIDYGDWYQIHFVLSRPLPPFICQKSLITQGSIEEFETLFAEKIVKK